MEERTAQLELGSFIIENEITINYIRKPSSDIILALRQIDSNVLRGPRIKEDRGTPAAYELPPGSSEANSRVSVRHCCQTMSIPLYAASAAEITLFKSCNALGCRAPCASVLTGKSAIELLKLFGRPHQAESLRRELERVGDPSLRGKVYTPSPDAKGDDAPRKRRAAEPKPRKLMVVDPASDSPSLKAKRVRRQPRQWLPEAAGCEEEEQPLLLRNRREDLMPGVRGLSLAALGLSALGVHGVDAAGSAPDCTEHGVRAGWVWDSSIAGAALLGRPTASLALAGASALSPLRSATRHAHAHAPTLLTTALANVAASTAATASTASIASLASATGAIYPHAGAAALPSSSAAVPAPAAPALVGLSAGLAGRRAPGGALTGPARGLPSLQPALWRAQSHAAPPAATAVLSAEPSRDSAKEGLVWHADSRDDPHACARVTQAPPSLTPPPTPSPAALPAPPSPAGTGLSLAALHALDGARHLRCEQCGRAAHLPLSEALRHGAEVSGAQRTLTTALTGQGISGTSDVRLQPADILARALAVDCAQANPSSPNDAHPPASDACGACPFALRGGAPSVATHCHRLCAVLLLVAQAPHAHMRGITPPAAHGAPLSPPVLTASSSASSASTVRACSPTSATSPHSPGPRAWPALVSNSTPAPACAHTPTQAHPRGVSKANPYAVAPAPGPSLGDLSAIAAVALHGGPMLTVGCADAGLAPLHPHAHALAHSVRPHVLATVHPDAMPRGRPSVSAGQ